MLLKISSDSALFDQICRGTGMSVTRIGKQVQGPLGDSVIIDNTNLHVGHGLDIS